MPIPKIRVVITPANKLIVETKLARRESKEFLAALYLYKIGIYLSKYLDSLKNKREKNQLILTNDKFIYLLMYLIVIVSFVDYFKL